MFFYLKAPEHEVIMVMKISIVVVGIVATGMALSVKSIYGLWYLSSDLVYVILFPQLVCVVHFKRHCNTYGSLCAYMVGFLMRALGGEDILGMPALIKYPWYDEVDGQLFPFRTFAMITSFIVHLSVSTGSKYVFETGMLPPEYDIFHCVVNIPDDAVQVSDPHEEMTVLSASQALYYQTSELNGRVNPALETDEEEQQSRAKLLERKNVPGKTRQASLAETELTRVAKRILTTQMSTGSLSPELTSKIKRELAEVSVDEDEEITIGIDKNDNQQQDTNF